MDPIFLILWFINYISSIISCPLTREVVVVDENRYLTFYMASLSTHFWGPVFSRKCSFLYSRLSFSSTVVRSMRYTRLTSFNAMVILKGAKRLQRTGSWSLQTSELGLGPRRSDTRALILNTSFILLLQEWPFYIHNYIMDF